MAQPKVLIACEFSGVVRNEFSKLGWYAVSCDLLPTEYPGRHYQGDVFDIIHRDWDLIIAHPPCTYLCVSGLHWNDRGRGWEKTESALQFVADIMNVNCPRIVVENPRGCIATRLGRDSSGKVYVRYRKFEGNDALFPPSQIIQPYRFGDDASKETWLYLKGVPPLKETEYISPRIVNGLYRWGNQLDDGQNALHKYDDRSMDRAKTYPGIAKAMATQWTKYILGK